MKKREEPRKGRTKEKWKKVRKESFN